MKKESNLKRLLRYAKGFRWFTIASWILSAVSALILLVPFVYIWLIIRQVLHTAPQGSPDVSLAYYGWMAVLFSALGAFVYVTSLLCSHIGAFRIARNLRIHIISHIVTLPQGIVEGVGTGKLRKVVNEATAATETYLAHQLPDKAGAIATPIGLVILLLIFDWRLGILSILPVLLGFLIMSSMTRSELKSRMEHYQNSLDDMSNQAVEYIRGIPVVKTFGQTIHSFKRFKAAIDTYEKWVISYSEDLLLPMTLFTAAINGVFVFLIAGTLVFTHKGISSDFLLSLLFYIIITPIITVTLSRIMFQSENALVVDDAISRIDSILDLKPQQEPVTPKHPLDSSVELKDVSFSYDGAGNALSHISLRIEPGKTVAFVGPSGGGKTTTANLISRFFDADSGQILIGGVDVQEIAKKELMEHISYVFQNSKLLKDTIFNNVRLGKPQASRQEVLEALKEAQCMDIIEKFPDGIDTMIGTRGIYLSGGEQQRLAIARALLKNSPILILDEATAYADPDNESRVQQAFSRLAAGKTVIMIAHRLSTIVNADAIYVLKNGSIAESGTHQELIAKQGAYTAMWSDYQSSISWKVTKGGQTA